MNCLSAISPLIIDIIKSSLSFASVPQIFKQAHVTSIITKLGLNLDVLLPLNSEPTSSALSWFHSYLNNYQRSQGVLQVVVLDTLLFILNMLPLGNIICHHSLQFHSYVDDIQLHISTKAITTTHSTLTVSLISKIGCKTIMSK